MKGSNSVTTQCGSRIADALEKIQQMQSDGNVIRGSLIQDLILSALEMDSFGLFKTR